MKALLSTLFLLLTSLGTGLKAEPVVVVNAESNTHQLSQAQVVDIFLGRYRSLPSGGVALPIDQPESGALKAEFYRRLVNKELNEINAYWARLIFSGRTSPPVQATHATDVPLLLMRNPDGVAYIERSQADKRFRIVMEFPR